jgi:hypothetical protein
MTDLIEAVLADPVAALQGKSAAANALVAIGPSALPLIQDVIDGSWSSAEHPKDVLEAFMLVASRIHERDTRA